jgi:LacI family transcriptional regulator
LVITNLHTPSSIGNAVRLLIEEKRATALFTAQNLITVESIRTLHTMGMVEKIALVGFDDFDTADLLVPAVTVIAQDPKVIGALACEILLRRIDGDSSPVKTHVIPVILITRGSGEIEPMSIGRRGSGGHG